MRDRLKLALQFDADALRADVDRLEGDSWIAHYVKQHYDGSWDVIPLRAPAGATHPIATIYADPNAEAYVDTPVLERSPYLQQIVAAFQCRLEAVRLMKLAPGSAIKPHRDHDLGASYGKARLHIPVVTNDRVEFILNGRPVTMRAGECWYLDLSSTHSVANRGDDDRIHLVIDAVINPWLQARLDAAEAASTPTDSAVTTARVETPSPDAVSSIGALRRRVWKDDDVRRRLEAIESRDEFVAAISQAYELSAADVERTMRASRRRAREPIRADDADPELLALMRSASFDGWVPFRIGGSMVDWCHLGVERFTAPFFGDTVDRCLRKPFNQLFPRLTDVDALLEHARTSPGLAPTAFIFHSSRCGSTLMAQMAAALPDTVVVSEAPAFDHVLLAHGQDDERVEVLRALVSALGQARRAGDRQVIVKFDAWHIGSLALVRRAFPDVPCAFVYRDPAEVMASQLRMPGLHTVPGMLDPGLIGIDLATAIALGRDEYASRMLGAIYAAAAQSAAAETMMLINYCDLPARAFEAIVEWCRPDDQAAALVRMREVAAFDAKTPSQPFDVTAVRTPLHTAASDLVDRFVRPYYVQLEERRLASARVSVL